MPLSNKCRGERRARGDKRVTSQQTGRWWLERFEDERRRTGELWSVFIHFRPELQRRMRSVVVT